MKQKLRTTFPSEVELEEFENRSYENAEDLLEKIKVEKKKLEAERKKGKYRKQ